ncbi:MAG: hypothetical protein ACRC5F_06900 [Cetobacterium sp.]
MLVCRPRRFGKTLNIEKTEVMSHQGKYPVIYLTLKELTGVSYDDFFKGFKRLISKLFKEHKHLKEFLDADDFEAFEKIVKIKDDGDYDIALQFLSELYEE